MDRFNPAEALKKAWKSTIVLRTESEKASRTFKPKYLANLDSAGEGPKNAFRIGKQVAYPAEDFFNWLAERIRPIHRNSRRAPEDQAN